MTRLLITAAFGVFVLISPGAIAPPAARADDRPDAAASSPDPPMPPGMPAPAASPQERIAASNPDAASGEPAPTVAAASAPSPGPAPAAGQRTPAPSQRVAASRPTLFGWLAEPVRKILDPPKSNERSPSSGVARGSRGQSASTQKRVESKARDGATASAAADPEAPLPIATRTLPGPGDAAPQAASPTPESVVATRFVGSAEGRTAEAGESGLSPEPVAVQPDGGPERMSIERLLAKGAASLQVEAVSLAGNYFREAIAEAPEDPTIVARAGILALKHNRPELAVALVEPAIPRFGANGTLRQVLAMAKYRRGEYMAARALLQQALAVDKSSALSHYLLGCTLVKLDQRDLAQNHLRQAAQLDPKYASVR